jgi:hypothetical protein
MDITEIVLGDLGCFGSFSLRSSTGPLNLPRSEDRMAKFGLHVAKMKFNTQNEERIRIGIIIRTVKPCYNNISLYDTSSITSDILWYQLLPHC